MSSKEDYYQILGVDKNVTQEELKKKYSNITLIVILEIKMLRRNSKL